MKWGIIIVLLLFLGACRKTTNNALPYFYEYYPLEIGAWVEYDVTDILHTSTGSDTTIYFLKELIADQFIDDQGRLTYRLIRKWRPDLTSAWSVKDIWTTNLTQTTAEKVEENQRYLKLVFPVTSFKVWDGNSANNQKEWDYYYDSVHIDRNINGLQFDSTLKVVQRDNVNLVENEQAEEIYAKHIGLVYKRLIDYDWVFNNREGRELEMIVRAYGK